MCLSFRRDCSLGSVLMRILVTGSRYLSDYGLVMRALSVAIEDLVLLHPDDKEIIVVHGAAQGADSLAENFVVQSRAFMKNRGYTLRSEKHPANWSEFGKFAGPKRNQEMVDKGADVCVAFFQTGQPNKGTTHCSSAARKAGIPVSEFRS